MISQSKFEAALRLLQTHFNKQLNENVIAIWQEYLNQYLNDQQLTTAVKLAIAECEFMPTAKKLVELGCKSNENHQAYQEFKALPSQEMNMTEEERLENLRKLKAMWDGIGNKPKLKPKPEIANADYRKVADDVINQWKREGLI